MIAGFGAGRAPDRPDRRRAPDGPGGARAMVRGGSRGRAAAVPRDRRGGHDEHRRGRSARRDRRRRGARGALVPRRRRVRRVLPADGARACARSAGSSAPTAITLDPHKGLFLPYGTGGLIVRDRAAMRDAHFEGAAYLQDLPPSGRAAELQRAHAGAVARHAGLRVWWPLSLHGVSAFREALDEKLDLTERLTRRCAPTRDRGRLANRSSPSSRSGCAAATRRRTAAAARADQRVEARVPVLDADRRGVLAAGLHRVAPDARRPDRRVRRRSSATAAASMG